MGNKYYTPLIGEFHVGFEYEYFNTFSDKYESHIVTVENIVNEGIFDEIEVNKKTYSLLRVKYLDKEDIESLGFKCTKEYVSQPSFDESLSYFDYEFEGQIGIYKCTIQYISWFVGGSKEPGVVDPDSIGEYRKVKIKGTSGGSDNLITLFNGNNVKNKSVFRTILNTLSFEDYKPV